MGQAPAPGRPFLLRASPLQVHNGYFVDLFVRVSNAVAINMYTKVGGCGECGREKLVCLSVYLCVSVVCAGGRRRGRRRRGPGSGPVSRGGKARRWPHEEGAGGKWARRPGGWDTRRRSNASARRCRGPSSRSAPCTHQLLGNLPPWRLQFGYTVYRRVLGYYSNDEDAFGASPPAAMRRFMPASPACPNSSLPCRVFRTSVLLSLLPVPAGTWGDQSWRPNLLPCAAQRAWCASVVHQHSHA